MPDPDALRKRIEALERSVTALQMVLADAERLLGAMASGDMPHGSLILQVRKDARTLLGQKGPHA